MKLLFLTSKDATNFRIVNIIKKFIEYGHQIDIFPLITDDANIRMFQNIEQVGWLDGLDDESAQNYDAFFCANDTVWKVINYKKYIFSFNLLTLGNCLSEGADFMFIPGYTDRYEIREKCALMRIGNPIYDDYISLNEKTNNILFIDSGHYPFGKEGKRLLAKILIDVCNKFDKYTVTIKPRNLRTDLNPTHVNKNDLYSNIVEINGSIPYNMIYLDKHIEMKKLIDQCDTVMCMYTSAWLDAAVAGKGLIIIDGLPSEDSKDLNNKVHWSKARMSMLESGCLVHYSRVTEYLPHGIICNERQISQELFYRENVSSRIVEVVEKIMEWSRGKGLFLEEKEYHYSDFENELSESCGIDYNKIQANRILNKVRNVIYRFKDWMGIDIDLDELNQKFDELERKGLLLIDNLLEVEDYIWRIFEDIIISQIDGYLDNEIAISYLMPILFRKDKDKAYDLLERIKFRNRYVKYYEARKLEQHMDYENAIILYLEYVAEFDAIEYERFYTDNHDIYSSALFHIAECYYECKKYNEAYYYYSKCNEYENNNHCEAKKKIFKLKTIGEHTE